MTAYKFEYLWLDGYKPVANLRSKTKVINFENYNGELDELPDWNFDGSSTKQAEGSFSEIILIPKRVYPDPGRKNGFLVIAECYKPDGTPHETNTRHTIKDNEHDFWFGFEQEYVLLNDSGRPVGFPSGGYPEPQGPYYCSVGYRNNTGRELAEQHLDLCLEAGLGITGVNAEVMLGQWEFQCFGSGLKAADDLIVARYLLFRITEKHGVTLELHPKPIAGDWNGSGMHTNVSWTYLRDIGGKEYLEGILENFSNHHFAHMAVYGAHNQLRLTGAHETASHTDFSYGIGDRGASIRIPIFTVQDDYKGYIEDRRPASNADPYLIIDRIISTIEEVHEKLVK